MKLRLCTSFVLLGMPIHAFDLFEDTKLPHTHISTSWRSYFQKKAGQKSTTKREKNPVLVQMDTTPQEERNVIAHAQQEAPSPPDQSNQKAPISKDILPEHPTPEKPPAISPPAIEPPAEAREPEEMTVTQRKGPKQKGISSKSRPAPKHAWKRKQQPYQGQTLRQQVHRIMQDKNIQENFETISDPDYLAYFSTRTKVRLFESLGAQLLRNEGVPLEHISLKNMELGVPKELGKNLTQRVQKAMRSKRVADGLKYVKNKDVQAYIRARMELDFYHTFSPEPSTKRTKKSASVSPSIILGHYLRPLQ